jgi:hypothetical protein
MHGSPIMPDPVHMPPEQLFDAQSLALVHGVPFGAP